MNRIALLLVIFLATCCSRELETKEYVAWVKDPVHQLHVIKSFNEYVFDVQYQPAELLALQNPLRPLKTQALQYYELNISMTDGSTDIFHYGLTSEAELGQREYYFSFKFQNDIHLEQGDQILPCVLFHNQQSPVKNNAKTFLLAFENPDIDLGESKLVIDSEFFGALPVKIKILKNAPTLKKI